MAGQTAAKSAGVPALEIGTITNFAGGPNFRDAPSELATAETYGSWNVTYDERGGASSRLGYTKRNNSVLGNGTTEFVVNDFYSQIAGVFLTQVGPKLYRNDNTSSVHTFSTSACVTFTEIAGKIIAAHPVDGLLTSTDGTAWVALDVLGVCTITNASPAVITLTAHGRVAGDTVTFTTTGGLPTGLTVGTVYYVITAGLTPNAFEVSLTSGGAAVNTSSAGSGVHTLHTANVPTAPTCVVSWQNKLFVGLADGTVHWSELADLTRWLATDFNAVWTLDQEPVVALAAGAGQDIQGRGGLLVFKQGSVYRINNAATGAYTVLSASEGAAGPKAVIGVGARVCWIGTRGIFWWREDQAGPVPAGDILQPVWAATQLSIANQAGWCAGRVLERVLFSCSTLNSSVNDLAFEYHPDEGWLAPRSDAVTCYAHAADATDRVCGGSPTVPGQAYTLATSGSDDGTAIDWWLQTRWIIPNGGFQANLWQIRIHARGAGTLTVRADYQDTGGTDRPFSLALAILTYDSGLFYDSGLTYTADLLQATEPFYDLGTVRQFSVRFSGSSTTTVINRTLFGNVSNAVVGYFGLYGLEYLFTPLGLS